MFDAPPLLGCQAVWGAMLCEILCYHVSQGLYAREICDAHRTPEIISCHCVLINCTVSIERLFLSPTSLNRSDSVSSCLCRQWL